MPQRLENKVEGWLGYFIKSSLTELTPGDKIMTEGIGNLLLTTQL